MTCLLVSSNLFSADSSVKRNLTIYQKNKNGESCSTDVEERFEEAIEGETEAAVS